MSNYKYILIVQRILAAQAAFTATFGREANTVFLGKREAALLKSYCSPWSLAERSRHQYAVSKVDASKVDGMTVQVLKEKHALMVGTVYQEADLNFTMTAATRLAEYEATHQLPEENKEMNNVIILTDEQARALSAGEDIVIKSPRKKPKLFKPEGAYYFVDTSGTPAVRKLATPFSLGEVRRDNYNSFRTGEDAYKAAKAMRINNAMIMAALAVDPASDLISGGYTCRYNRDRKKWRKGSTHVHQCRPTVTTHEQAIEMATLLNELDLFAE